MTQWLIAVAVLARPAIPGESKTRLIPQHGKEEAAALARAFFIDTWQSVCALPWARTILATTDPSSDQWAAIPTASVVAQGNGDLGQRLERVVRQALTQATSVLAIGADTPGLPERLLTAACDALASADAVLGPCADGGFYLVGLKGCPAGLFRDLPWSEPTTFAATRARLLERGMTVRILEPWFDVDRSDDLQRLRRTLMRGAISAPATARLIAALPGAPTVTPRISVIVPVLNEEARIGPQLAALMATADLHEVLVVDGDSTDRTLEIARSFPRVRVLETEVGRARQMNAGAAVAHGDVLLFLHADVRLPNDATCWIREALADPTTVAGAFRTWTVPDAGRSWLSPLLHLADLRSRYSSLPYGDQALFVRTQAFHEHGGFRELPLMEDLDLSRRLKRAGRIRTVRARVLVSGRRFLARPVYYSLVMNLFPLLYRLGMPPRVLARMYGKPR